MAKDWLPIESLESCELPPAYYDGYEKGEENKGSGENPFPLGTSAHTCWSIGFADALEENPHFGPVGH